MELSEKDHLLIEKYLSRQLDEDEEELFRQRRSDPSFANELDFQIDLKRVAKSFERDELRKIMRAGDKSSEASLPFLSQRYRNILTWSAAAVLLLISIFVFLLPMLPDSEAELYSTYYEPYPNTISPITKGESETMDGFQMYELGQYDQAIETLTRETIPEVAGLFYLGLSFLGADQTTSAIEVLQQIVSEDSEYKVPAQWYLALAYLKKGEKASSIPLLQDISQTDHPLSTKAANLLMDLE